MYLLQWRVLGAMAVSCCGFVSYCDQLHQKCEKGLAKYSGISFESGHLTANTYVSSMLTICAGIVSYLFGTAVFNAVGCTNWIVATFVHGLQFSARTFCKLTDVTENPCAIRSIWNWYPLNAGWPPTGRSDEPEIWYGWLTFIWVCCRSSWRPCS